MIDRLHCRNQFHMNYYKFWFSSFETFYLLQFLMLPPFLYLVSYAQRKEMTIFQKRPLLMGLPSLRVYHPSLLRIGRQQSWTGCNKSVTNPWTRVATPYYRPLSLLLLYVITNIWLSSNTMQPHTHLMYRRYT